MKKILASIIIALLAIATSLTMVGCGGSSGWAKPSLTNWGEVTSVGGFIAETENYLYFINGVGTSTDDNTFGAPVKGSLMAVEKSSLDKEAKDIKSEIVVPKLFVASDYNAGIYIYGSGAETYVYYGTPNTSKNSSGAIANNELTFKRTRLDGEKEETFFTIGSLSAEYRIVESNGVVYIVYYDSAESSLKCYNTADKSTIVIAKTDATKAGRNAVSLDKYYFADNKDLNSAVVYYTATVYNEEYYEEEAEEESYIRTPATYNYVYSYKIGDPKDQVSDFYGTKVLDGTSSNLKYAITYCKKGWTVFTETDVNSKIKTYITESTNLLGFNGLSDQDKKAMLVNNSENVQENMYIVSPQEIYLVDGENNRIIKTTLVGSETSQRTSAISAETVNNIVNVKIEGEDRIIYFYNGSQISRMKAFDNTAKEEQISGTSTSTAWYAPEFITVGEKEYVFYCDNTTVGSSYISFVDLGGTIVGEDTDDDDEDDKWYLEGNKLIGKMLASDRANAAVDKINKIPTELEYEIDGDGNLFVEKVAEAREVYDNLDKEAKDAVGETYVTALIKAEKGVTLSAKLYKLEGISGYEDKTDAEKQAYQTAYNDVMAYKTTLSNNNEWAEILARVDANLKANMTTAQKIFED